MEWTKRICAKRSWICINQHNLEEPAVFWSFCFISGLFHRLHWQKSSSFHFQQLKQKSRVSCHDPRALSLSLSLSHSVCIRAVYLLVVLPNSDLCPVTSISCQKLRSISRIQSKWISQTSHKQGPRQLELCLRCFTVQNKQNPGYEMMTDYHYGALCPIKILEKVFPLSLGCNNYC